MKQTLSAEELAAFTQKQLDFYIPDGYTIDEASWKNAIHTALERCDHCFQHILIPQYKTPDGESAFSHLHRDQYAVFLYFLGNTLWTRYGQKQLCDKLLNLQSILHSFFLSYKCEMPNVFVLAHPIGSIIGNANYSDGLYISQNVTINTHTDASGNIDLYIGKGGFFSPNVTVIGNQPIGDRVSIGANVLIYNQKIEHDHTCINENGQLKIRPRLHKNCFAQQIFDLDLD